MVENAVTTEAFGILENEDWNTTVEDITQALHDLRFDSSTKAHLEDKFTVALLGLGITDMCHGFVKQLLRWLIIPTKSILPGSRSVR